MNFFSRQVLGSRWGLYFFCYSVWLKKIDFSKMGNSAGNGDWIFFLSQIEQFV